MTNSLSPQNPPLGIGLISGGLDSILAARVVLMQGIRVIAYRFISPFFGWDSRGHERVIEEAFKARHGFELRLRSVWPDYLDIVRTPRHGYGRNLNPCIDCKIFMLRRAALEMEREGAAFVFTGEVLGQRPMSQRRDALHLIENRSGLKGRLVRPLSAGLLPPSQPEQEGVIDRRRLLDFRGRSRRPQLEMARRLGITDYTTPAGGCLLADRGFAGRLRSLLTQEPSLMDAGEIEILTVGRHFSLGEGTRLVVGRNEAENRRIAELASEEDLVLQASDLPGPLSLLRGSADAGQVALAARITARYADHLGSDAVKVAVSRKNGAPTLLNVAPASPDIIETARS